MAYVILLLFALIMAIAVIVLNEGNDSFCFSRAAFNASGYFLIGMVIKLLFEVDRQFLLKGIFNKSGLGWWIVLSCFAVAAAGGFIAKKQVSHRE